MKFLFFLLTIFALCPFFVNATDLDEDVKNPWGPVSKGNFAGNNDLNAHFPDLNPAVEEDGQLNEKRRNLNLQVVKTEWQIREEVDPRLEGQFSKVFVIYVLQETWDFLEDLKVGCTIQNFDAPGDASENAIPGEPPLTYSSLVGYIEQMALTDEEKPEDNTPYRVEIRLDEQVVAEDA